MDQIFFVIILIISVVIHEVSHGFAAEYFGDPTARMADRLTLNPFKHLDLFGSIILPVLLVLFKSPFMFGFAKPVPYNPNNLRNLKWGTLAVASAGVLANLMLAIIFGLILRFLPYGSVSEGLIFILSTIVIINLSLFIFNLVPIPPLDGSKILFSFLPTSLYNTAFAIERYSLLILIIFIVYFANYLSPVMSFLFTLITGFSL